LGEGADVAVVVGILGIITGLASIAMTFAGQTVLGMILGSVAFPMGLLGISMAPENRRLGARLSGGAMLIGVVGLGLGAVAAYGSLFPQVPGGTE
jgi:uncharacterized membrane protein HdeD (DUF308 family)